MAKEGWKWSGHTHPETGRVDLFPSPSDILILKAFGQNRSVIYNANGSYRKFEV